MIRRANLTGFLIPDTAATDPSTIIYTSGTTGPPKGVLLSHDNIHSNIRACARLFQAGADDEAVSFLPLSHILERMVDYWFFANGVSIAYVGDIKLVADALREVRPTVAVSTPRLYEKVYDAVLAQPGVVGSPGPFFTLPRWRLMLPRCTCGTWKASIAFST